MTLVYLARLTGVSAGIDGAASVDAFAEALLAAVSLVSTSGMETRFGVIALAPPLVVLFVLLVGASVLSSAGGVKIYRVLAMARLSLRELLQLIYPSMVSRRRRLRTYYSEVSIVTVCTVFVGFLMTIAAGTVLLNATGLPFDAAFTLAVTAISNAGPVYESLAPATVSDIDWPPVLRLSDLQLIVSSILMVLGRLEILLFIIVIGLRFWRQS